MFQLDHVIIAVEDLDKAALSFKESFGLNSVYGGRHPGFGTANRIIPFGQTFLELLAIVDHDEFDRSGLSLPKPESFVGWGVRTEQIDSVANDLGLSVRRMSRRREDGLVLEWRIAGLESFGVDRAQPLFLDWSSRQDHHPARSKVIHDVPVEDVSWVEVSGDSEQVARWRQKMNLDVRVVEGPPAVRAAGLASMGSEIEVRFTEPV